MTDKISHFSSIGSRVSRRNFLTASATIAAGRRWTIAVSGKARRRG